MDQEQSTGFVFPLGVNVPVFMQARIRPSSVRIELGEILPAPEDTARELGQPGYDWLGYRQSEDIPDLFAALLRLFGEFEEPDCLTSEQVDSRILTDDAICRWCVEHGMPSALPEYSVEMFRTQAQMLMMGYCSYMAWNRGSEKCIRAARTGLYSTLYRYYCFLLPDPGERMRIVRIVEQIFSGVPDRDNTQGMTAAQFRSRIFPYVWKTLNSLLERAHPHMSDDSIITGKSGTNELRIVLTAEDVFSAMAYALACKLAGRSGPMEICFGCGKPFKKTGPRSKYCGDCDRRTLFSRRQRAKKKAEG